MKCLENNPPQFQTGHPESEPGFCSDNLAASHLSYGTVQATPHCLLTHDTTSHVATDCGVLGERRVQQFDHNTHIEEAMHASKDDTGKEK